MSLERGALQTFRYEMHGFNPDDQTDVSRLYRAVLADPTASPRGVTFDRMLAVAIRQSERLGFIPTDLSSVRPYAHTSIRAPGTTHIGPAVGFEFEFRKAA